MKRKLLKQIIKEWRSNLWITIELMLVSGFVFGLIFYLYNALYVYNMPKNYNLDNTYLLNYGYIPYGTDGFDEEAAKNPEPTQRYNLLKTLRSHPIVEAVTFSFAANPYCTNSQGISCRADTTGTDYHSSWLYQISPDYPRVYRLKGTNGETPERLAALVKEGKVLITKDMFPDAGNLINTYIYDTNNTAYLVGAVVEPMRRYDYSKDGTGFFMPLPDPSYGAWVHLAVRIKPEFKGDVTKTLVKEIRSGNMIIKSVQPMSDVRRQTLRSVDTRLRNVIIIAIFMLFNLFLGVLGTFWLRSQARTGEIAIRKVNGAADMSILRRMLGESMILMTTAAAIGLPAGFLFIKYVFGDDYYTSTIVPSMAITYAAVTLMTLLGTLFPTLKAMHVNPAEALKSE